MNQTTCKILIVDDNRTNVEILEEMLSEEYITQTAACGREALAAVEEFLPDIILLDIMMPDLNGYEVCVKIRANERMKYTKVIMVSAKALVQERLQGYEAGADDYIVKPFDQDELLAKVRVYSKLKSAEEVQDALQEALGKAQDAEKTKSQFLANMSHEIRTPLNVIIGFTDCILEENLSEEIRTQMQMIKQSGKHLLQLISDILDFSKIESGKINLEVEPFDLTGFLSDLEACYSLFGDEKEIDFRVIHETPLPPEMVSDSFRLKQCLFNLIQNAIKFTEQGHVYLKVSAIRREESEVLVFQVEDTGIGIAVEKQKTIFDPFVQAENGTCRKFGGTGLGLTITHHLVQLLGGRLLLESEEGKGSTFTIVMPLKKENTEGVPIGYEDIFHEISSMNSRV